MFNRYSQNELNQPPFKDIMLPLVLQEYYLPYREQHVGYQEGHFYGNQQSYSRDLGEVPYDNKKEEAQYSFDEYKPTPYEYAEQSTSEYEEHNYEIQTKQPHQDSPELEENQYELPSSQFEHSHYIDAEYQLEGEEYQFEDLESKANLSTKEEYDEGVQFNENLGFLPPYIAAAQPRSFAHPLALSGYKEKFTSSEIFSGRRNWSPSGLNQYRVHQSLPRWT